MLRLRQLDLLPGRWCRVTPRLELRRHPDLRTFRGVTPLGMVSILFARNGGYNRLGSCRDFEVRMSFLPALATLALSMIVAFSSNPGEAKTCEEPDNVAFVQGTRHCLAIETFTSASRADTLVVTLHGALSRGGTADYMVRFAREISALGVSTVAMMHPGYTGAGRTSSGRPARDRHRDDNYRKREIDSIASALETLKTHHGAKRLILVGHSLGSIFSGVILGRHPDVAEAALLVACPCNMDSWRRSRGRQRLPSAQSPHRYVRKIAPDTEIVALTGSEDNNTLPSNARDYVAEAKRHGLEATFVLVQGAGHGFSPRLADATLTAVSDMLGSTGPETGTGADESLAFAKSPTGPRSTTVEHVHAVLEDLREWPPDSAEVPPTMAKEWGGNNNAKNKYGRLFAEGGALESIEFLETFQGADVYWVRFENARLLVRYARDGSGMMRLFRSTPFGLRRN